MAGNVTVADRMRLGGMALCLMVWALTGYAGGVASAQSADVKVWEEPMVIPTYELGPVDPNPMFYTHESYQGAQKRVYPYPLQDRLTHVSRDRTYTALNLENEYIRLTVLPEIGGRLFAATDKTNNYDFFYRQHVIKPALIGMLGAWISGGVEWCAFHHHRNTTFLPVDYRMAEHSDGSKTIWLGEIERRHRMKWLIGLTLHPGRSYIETTVKLFNRTPYPHSILYWANVAVHVSEDYQVVFPPSVQVATHHSKISFTHWPISQGPYCGHDYSGLDISRYRNLARPVSFFAWDLQEDFMGGYDHGRRAGTVHVADHHVVCGAKLWSWGRGPASQLWDSILTDTDGPYAELMVGAWSDNQPDYSWIKPYEVKAHKQYWYPVRDIGGFKNANVNGAVNLELESDHMATVGFHTTSRHFGAKALLVAAGHTVFEQEIDIDPGQPFLEKIAVSAGTKATDLRASLIGGDGEELIAFQPVRREPVEALPDPVTAPPAPKEIETIEELYLTGLRVEQIHNPAVDPMSYYTEALERDPDDSRCNMMVGMHYGRRGMYGFAEEYLRRAIRRVSTAYTRPGNTEPYYHLGLVLRRQGRNQEARDCFHRASWDYAFHSAAFYELAELSCCESAFTLALAQISESLSTNTFNTRARNVKAMILRKLGRIQEAEVSAIEVLETDPLDVLAGNERYLALLAGGEQRAASEALTELRRTMRDEVQSYLELATDYMNCGFWDEAMGVLSRPIEAEMAFASTYPIVHYYLGYLHERNGNVPEARMCYRRAAAMPDDYCFPFRLETVDVLNAAIRVNDSDARAYYYLGNLLFELQPEEAIACWNKSACLNNECAIVHRNLGWACYRVHNDIARAIEHYEKAVARNSRDPRLFFELDVLYQIGNVDPRRRLALLTEHHEVVSQLQDAFFREIMVLVLAGSYDAAIDYLSTNRFHAREGGKGIHEVWTDAHLLRGLACMEAEEFSRAVRDFEQALESPANLAAPRNSWRIPEVSYHLARACEAMGDKVRARRYYEQGAAHKGSSLAPQTQYYHALCRIQLGDVADAKTVFDDLIRLGQERLTTEPPADFFAKFGERPTENARQASAHFAIGLGLLGKGQRQQAIQAFDRAVKLDRSHVWARFQLSASGKEEDPSDDHE